MGIPHSHWARPVSVLLSFGCCHRFGSQGLAVGITRYPGRCDCSQVCRSNVKSVMNKNRTIEMPTCASHRLPDLPIPVHLAARHLIRHLYPMSALSTHPGPAFCTLHSCSCMYPSSHSALRLSGGSCSGNFLNSLLNHVAKGQGRKKGRRKGREQRGEDPGAWGDSGCVLSSLRVRNELQDG